MTALFCDIVGSTKMSARLDLGDHDRAIRAYWAVCRKVIAEFDGFVDKCHGDDVLAYFGYPEAREDDAVRAVRAGFAIVAALAGDNALRRLRVRIGIATDFVAAPISDRRATTDDITGPTPNIAARIQKFAAPGTVVIAQSTHKLVMRQFECEDLGERHLKGIWKPIRLWRVLCEQRTKTTPVDFVGRERDIALLRGRWQQVSAPDGRGQAVMVSGEAGIGKSRLVERLRAQLAADDLIDVRLECAQSYRNTPLYPFIAYLEQTAGCEPCDGSAEKFTKISQLMPVGHDGASSVAALLSLPSGNGNPSSTTSPARQRALTQAFLIDHIFGLTSRRPVLLVVEDVHWLDPTTEEIVMRLLDRAQDHRILVLLTMRSDSACASPLVDHPQVTPLTLNRLRPDEAERMISEASGRRRLPADVTKLILDKADGVPLFIEELTKAVLESNGTFSPWSVPSTLEGTLRARLDRLAEHGDVARVGAAIGRSFSYALVKAVMKLDDRRLRVALNRLVETKLVYRHGAPKDAVYTFKHALVQDAAYESLLRSDRISLHAHIVDAMQRHFPDTAQTEPEVLAHHCSCAERGEQAVRYWLKAGARALGRSANLEAIHHLRKGLASLRAVRSTQDRARLELEMQLALGEALIAARGYTATETTMAFSRAELLARKIGQVRQCHSALFGVFASQLIGGDLEAAARTIDQMYELADREEDDAYRCLAYRLRGNVSFFSGDLSTAHDALSKAIRLCDPAQQRQLAPFRSDTGPAAQIFLAMTEWLIGRPDSALKAERRAIENAHQLDNALTLGQVLTLGAQLRYMSQDYEDMLRLSKKGRDHCERHGIAYFGAICRLHYAWAQAQTPGSDPADYIGEFQRGLADYKDMKCGLQLGLFHVMLAQLMLAAGAAGDAAKEAKTALATIAGDGKRSERWWLPEFYRTLGDALLASSNLDAARDCFGRAINEADRLGSPMLGRRAAARLAAVGAAPERAALRNSL